LPALGRAAGEWIASGFTTGKWPCNRLLVAPVGVLATLNPRHFAGLEGLQVEDWRE